MQTTTPPLNELTSSFPRFAWSGHSLFLAFCASGLLLLSFQSAAVEAAAGPIIYVAPDGDDAHPGTEAQPLKTLAAAQKAVRRVLQEEKEKPIQVALRGGVYRIEQPLRFATEDSGRDNQPVTWRAHKDERVVISGGRPITGWQTAEDGTWRARVPEVAAGQWQFRELFVEGERRPRARHPNEGFHLVERAGSDRRTYFHFREHDIPAAAGHQDMEVILFHDWSSSRVPVKSIDHEQRVLRAARQFGASLKFFTIDNWEQHPRYYLENDPAFLDAPGEWFLDRAKGELRYKPFPGETLDGFSAIAPYSPGLLEIRGTAEQPVRNLHFKGLRLEHAAWSLPEIGYLGVQATAHDPLNGPWQWVPAAVSFELAENCSFQSGRIAHLGTSGIEFGSRTRNCLLENTFITDVAGNGVMIGEDRSRAFQGKPWWQVSPDEAATGNVVRNNLIEHCGRLYYGAVGVWVGIARETLVIHNTVRYLPYTGVSLGWMWSPTPTPARDNRVEYNYIHHVMQVLSDGGGIYTLGRQPGSRLRGNVIHTVPINLGRAESNGIFLDEGTTEFVVEGNVIYNLRRAPLRWHQARENQVRGNILVIDPGMPFSRYNSTDSKLIAYEANQVIPAAEFDPENFINHLSAAGLQCPCPETMR
jgi:hypothetical protein